MEEEYGWVADSRTARALLGSRYAPWNVRAAARLNRQPRRH